MAAIHAALSAMIEQLWKRGIPVVAVCYDRDEVVFVIDAYREHG